jgi:hypothetical protein
MQQGIALSVLVLTSIVSGLPQQPQKTLVWEPCPDLNKQIAAAYAAEGFNFKTAPFDCAHLKVPLDYHNPKSRLIELDLFRVNATKEPVLGSVLYNPGGPGGTGAENLPLNAPDLHLNIGGQYNLISCKYILVFATKTAALACRNSVDKISQGIHVERATPFLSTAPVPVQRLALLPGVTSKHSPAPT